MLKSLYRHITRQEPAEPDSGFDLEHAEDLVRAGNNGAARTVFERCLRIHLLDARALHVSGLIELTRDQPLAAAAILERAIEIDASDPVARADPGLALWRCGRPEVARDALESVVRAAPLLGAPALNLKEVYLALGDPVRTHRVLRDALAHAEAMRGTEETRMWLALAGLELFVPQVDGLACFENTFRLDPESTTIPVLGYMFYARRCHWSFPSARLAEFLEMDALGRLPGTTRLVAPAVADGLPVSRRALPRIADLRRRCIRTRSDSPWCDTPSYTRHLEAAHSTMHAIAVSGVAPAAFCVSRQSGALPC